MARPHAVQLFEDMIVVQRNRENPFGMSDRLMSWLAREFLRDLLTTTFSPRDGLCTTPCLRYTATFVERMGGFLVDALQLSLARLFSNGGRDVTRAASMNPRQRAALWTPITQLELDDWSEPALDMSNLNKRVLDPYPGNLSTVATPFLRMVHEMDECLCHVDWGQLYDHFLPYWDQGSIVVRPPRTPTPFPVHSMSEGVHFAQHAMRLTKVCEAFSCKSAAADFFATVVGASRVQPEIGCRAGQVNDCITRCSPCLDQALDPSVPADSMVDSTGQLCSGHCASHCAAEGARKGDTLVWASSCIATLSCPPLNVSHFRTTITLTSPGASGGCFACDLSFNEAQLATTMGQWLDDNGQVDPIIVSLTTEKVTAETARPTAAAGTVLVTAESHSSLEMHQTVSTLGELVAVARCRDAAGLGVDCVGVNLTTYEVALSGYCTKLDEAYDAVSGGCDNPGQGSGEECEGGVCTPHGEDPHASSGLGEHGNTVLIICSVVGAVAFVILALVCLRCYSPKLKSWWSARRLKSGRGRPATQAWQVTSEAPLSISSAIGLSVPVPGPAGAAAGASVENVVVEERL